MPVQRKKKTEITKARLVVGIGASAGGVGAMSRLFGKLRAIEGTAFIVIQHLEESGKRLALDSLKSVSSLPIVEIVKGVRLEAGKIYACPPHTLVSVESGVFKTWPARSVEEKLSVIDYLFTSLGKEYSACAVGVILSGEASDGTMGVKQINDAGGLTIAQASAEHRSMPESAIATGAIDYVLEPEKIAQEIAVYARYLGEMSRRPNQAALKEQISSALTSICEILLKQTQHDFKHYKTSTLLRRIQRRMQVLQIASVELYIERLSAKKEEVDTLFKELLINVTHFFRDAEAFESLRTEVLARLLRERREQHKLRVWVAGCSTGEEPYSIAMLLRELLTGADNPPEIQIIATDIDDVALSAARRGSYPLTIAEHVSAERLARFFTKRGGRYHVNKDLREMCLFSIHNLINDPPFSQLDLISCRNVLIYLGPHLQKKLFPIFHYALRSGGYLFLGTSESITSHRELFKLMHSKHRLAQRKATAVKLPTAISSSVHSYLSQFQDAARPSPAELSLIGQRIALDEMPLKHAIVNDEGQILSASGGISKYVEIHEGPFQNSIFKLVKPSLRAPLRSVFKHARAEKRKFTNEDCFLRIDGEVERVGLIVQPMPQLGEDGGLFWIAFHHMGRSHGRAGGDTQAPGAGDAELLEQLERELTVLREELDKSTQDLEASNEELKSSNEELLSMNEELQSANEELETSKEEVQSSNEALQRGNTDLENLLAGTKIATLFLDEHLSIRGFTPEMTKIYHVQARDVGRQISDFTSLAVAMPPFPDTRAFTDEKTDEAEVVMPDGTVYLRRISPYRIQPNVRDGVVVTFVDITHLRNAETRYRQLADSMPHIVWTARPDGCLDYYNERWYEFTGYDRNSEGNMSWQPILHPEDLPRTEEAWSAAVRDGKPYENEARFWDRKSSSYRWFLGRALAVRGADGAIVKWYGSRVDIHDRVMAEEARRESELRFRNLANTIPQLAWMADAKGHIYWYNQRWYDYSGTTFEEMEGWGWQKVHDPVELTRVNERWQASLASGTPMELTFPLRRADGVFRWFLTRVVPLKDENGRITRWLGTNTDVHEHKVLSEELAAAKISAEAASESKTRFLANMSHEIRTPLAAIVGFSDLLREHLTDDKELNSYLDRIARNAGQLGRLIDELLDLSKIEADKLEIERAQVNVDTLIENVFSSVNLRAQEKKLDLKFEWRTPKPATLVTDPVRLAQILTNIVGNAVKFTETGFVRVEFAVNGDRLEVRVSDSGNGLTPEQIVRIFEPFMQADASVTRKYGGTGLGLALSKKLARLLGGDLVLVHSQFGKGSEFLITAAIDGAADAAARAPETRAESTASLLKSKRILVVDDSPDNRVIVTLFLQSAGAETFEASNGFEALELAEKETFDLILMDIQMPFMDGYKALERLQTAKNPTPVVALTAHAFKEERDRCLKAGFANYVTKPVNRKLLLNTVSDTIMRRPRPGN